MTNMIGLLVIRKEPVDQYNGVRFEQHLYPNGYIGDRNDYVWGKLYLLEPDYRRYLEIFENNPFWTIEVHDVPNYEQMSAYGNYDD